MSGGDHRDLVIEALADSEATHVERVASLEADVGTYRELAIAALDALSGLSRRHERLVAEHHRLQAEVKALREELLLRAGADDEDAA